VDQRGCAAASSVAWRSRTPPHWRWAAVTGSVKPASANRRKTYALHARSRPATRCTATHDTWRAAGRVLLRVLAHARPAVRPPLRAAVARVSRAQSASHRRVLRRRGGASQGPHHRRSGGTNAAIGSRMQNGEAPCARTLDRTRPGHLCCTTVLRAGGQNRVRTRPPPPVADHHACADRTRARACAFSQVELA
jgi:hypothetical protein